MRRGLTPALLVAACGGLLGLAPVGPAAAADPVCDQSSTVLESDVDPLDQLGIGRARALAGPPTRPPVRVAVLDSGVTGSSIPVAEQHTANGGGPVGFFHGTAVAGLIAGEGTGIAPDAEIVDVRVYDTDGSDTTGEGAKVSSDAVAAGLEWVARYAADLNIRVANVSLVVRGSDRLERAVRAAHRADVIVVASAGNRPDDEDEFAEDFADGGAGPREDAADLMFPTGYGLPYVVSASATTGGFGETDPTPYVVLNSATTVAVPTFGARTYGLDGRRCAVASVATSWAAAEVSGVLALLAQRFPDDTDEQLVARLVRERHPRRPDPAHRRRRRPGGRGAHPPARTGRGRRPRADRLHRARHRPRGRAGTRARPARRGRRRRGLVGPDRRRRPRGRPAAASGAGAPAYPIVVGDSAIIRRAAGRSRTLFPWSRGECWRHSEPSCWRSR